MAKKRPKKASKPATAGVSAPLPQPTKGFTRALAAEIVRNLTTLGQMTSAPFRRVSAGKKTPSVLDKYAILVDTSVLVDGRILPVAQSGFLTGTLILPRFILAEVQHIADSSDSLRRTKGRRGLDVANRLVGQKANPNLKAKVMDIDAVGVSEADHKLVHLAKQEKAAILTVDFNLAQLARAQGIRVLNVHTLAQAMRIALVPGEQLSLTLTHAGSQAGQGVGYMPDGTMVVVDNGQDKVGATVAVVVTKVHQTPAGQLFFARLA